MSEAWLYFNFRFWTFKRQRLYGTYILNTAKNLCHKLLVGKIPIVFSLFDKLILEKIAGLLSWAIALFLITKRNEISLTQANGLCLISLCPLDFLCLLFYSLFFKCKCITISFLTFSFFPLSSSSWWFWLIIKNEAGGSTTGHYASFLICFCYRSNGVKGTFFSFTLHLFSSWAC